MRGSINIRSSTLVQTVEFVRDTFGEEAAVRLVNTLPRAVGLKLEVEVLDTWVKFEVFHELLRQTVDRHYGGDISMIRHSGRYAAEKEFPRRFGALSLPADVSLVDQLNSFSTLWNIIVDRGYVKAAVKGDQIEFHICDFPLATEMYGHRLCGWLEGYFVILTKQPWRVELDRCDPEAESSLVFLVSLCS